MHSCGWQLQEEQEEVEFQMQERALFLETVRPTQWTPWLGHQRVSQFVIHPFCELSITLGAFRLRHLLCGVSGSLSVTQGLILLWDSRRSQKPSYFLSNSLNQGYRDGMLPLAITNSCFPWEQTYWENSTLYATLCDKNELETRRNRFMKYLMTSW